MEINIFTFIIFIVGTGVGLFIMWILNKSKLSVLYEKLSVEQQKTIDLEEKTRILDDLKIENTKLKKDIESYTEKLIPKGWYPNRYYYYYQKINDLSILFLKFLFFCKEYFNFSTVKIIF